MKLSKASAKTIPKEMLSESNENEEPTLAIRAIVFDRRSRCIPVLQRSAPLPFPLKRLQLTLLVETRMRVYEMIAADPQYLLRPEERCLSLLREIKSFYTLQK